MTPPAGAGAAGDEGSDEPCVCDTDFTCMADKHDSCGDCGSPLASPDEVESGLCLRCLNGPVPGPMEVVR